MGLLDLDLNPRSSSRICPLGISERVFCVSISGTVVAEEKKIERCGCKFLVCLSLKQRLIIKVVP